MQRNNSRILAIVGFFVFILLCLLLLSFRNSVNMPVLLIPWG